MTNAIHEVYHTQQVQPPENELGPIILKMAAQVDRMNRKVEKIENAAVAILLKTALERGMRLPEAKEWAKGVLEIET